MNHIDTILEKEKENTDSIFIFLVDGQFVAFARSAFYVSLLYPQLEVSQRQTDDESFYLCIHIPDNCLCNLTEKFNTLADDECIRITPPLNISRQRDYFGYWEVQLLYKHGITN